MILVVDDEKNIRLSLKLVLERNGYDVTLAEEPKVAVQIIRNTPAVELVLMDMNYDLSTSGEEGLTLLRQIKIFRPDLPCILMTAWGTIDLAVQGMRAGAFDFITKPWDNGVLLERIETARSLNPEPSSRGDGTKCSQRQNASDGQGQKVATPLSPWRGVGGEALSGILATVARVAPTNASVLITGESGTGKELIAEAIHRQSRRANGPFVKVNLGGISTSLFESEMFGHKKGSFTDAKADRIGRFELAKGGTIFLDEIGELSLASQVKLLRVLQDQTYEVLGDSNTRRTDVRVICATNADLRAMVEEHTFREDLFYRINLINLHLPPLRERREDIPLLVDFFLREASATNGLLLPTPEPKTVCPSVSPTDSSSLVTPDAIAYLQSLPFPGNIRELKNLVERALLMHDPAAPQLTAADFQSLSSEPAYPPSGIDDTVSLTNRWCPPVSPMGSSPASTTLEEMERAAIAAAIAKHAGNLSLVAKELGISRGALYRKIEKHKL